MKKLIKVSIEDGMSHCRTDGYPCIFLYDHDCEHIMKKFEGKEITSDDTAEALDLIVAYCVRGNVHKIEMDINERNQSLAPRKRMTIQEIEKELGYKIEIVDQSGVIE